MPGCRRDESEAPPDPLPPPVAAVPDTPNDAAPDEVPTHVEVGVEEEDSDRWLFVEAVRGEADGAWATGTFDARRNKLIIDTHEVAQFAVRLDRVPVDWQRLVVIRIDGVNAELRRREFAVYHIALDEHGRWTVLGP